MRQTFKSTAMKVGDWVRITPLWPGVWRVYRVLANFKEDEWSLDRPLQTSKRTIVFCHRLVNDAWKRSFAHNSCERSLVALLDNEEMKRVRGLLSDTKFLRAFESYQAAHSSIDLVANIALGGLTDHMLADLPNLCNRMLDERINRGLTIREVLLLMRDCSLYDHMKDLTKQRTIQLISLNHELRDGEFVFTRYRVLNY